jgi:hypothetical protein
LRDEFGVDSVIVFPKWAKGNNPGRIAEAKRRGLEIHQYTSRGDLERLAKRSNLTHNYVVSDGSLAGVSYSEDDPRRYRLNDLQHLTQAVFRRYEPHGDVYAYISEWLYDWSQSPQAKYFWGPLRRFHGPRLGDGLQKLSVDWVPHIVKPEDGDGPAFRRKYQIPIHAKVIGRIGGFDEFSDPAARRGLLSSIESNPGYYAVLVNTRRFANHPRIIHCDYLDRQEVWDFYAACDVLVNGRKMGESFGFSIVEPLSVGKPILAPAVIRNIRMDKHHVQLLKPFNLLYKNAEHFSRLIDEELSSPTEAGDLRAAAAPFSQSRVMKRFKDVYLNG